MNFDQIDIMAMGDTAESFDDGEGTPTRVEVDLTMLRGFETDLHSTKLEVEKLKLQVHEKDSELGRERDAR